MPADGPYVITTKRRRSPDPVVHPQVVSRRAVATLEAVQAGDFPMPPIRSREAFARIMDQLAELPESGGTVGPLPDGTVIEVEPVNSWDLANTGVGGDSLAEIIDAFNAQQTN